MESPTPSDPTTSGPITPTSLAAINRLEWHGRVLTGDALFGQRTLGQQVPDAGGDYLLTVKANQGTLSHALRQVFAAEARPLLECRTAQTIDQGHGRTAEVRRLIVTSDLLAAPDWRGNDLVDGHPRRHRWLLLGPVPDRGCHALART